ncbi:MAG: hypothetical protein FJ134_14460 [Deltaproteobacteria bacterium]|nr:hypothetical protein [Deltaproteobacteria bacterium]
MLWNRGWWAVLIIAAICGCTTVTSVAPVGERPQELSPEDWAGTWISKEQPIKIRVEEPRQGLLQVAWVEEKGGRLQFDSYQVELRAAGEWTFGNVKAKEGPAPYFWALVKNDEGQIIIWSPDPAQFRKLVQTGVLPGKVDQGGDVVLEKLTPAHLKAMMSGDRGVCFEWRKPLVFFRLGK